VSGRRADELGFLCVSDGAENLEALGITAVVLTHRRPRLAGDVVRGLLENEGFPPHRIVVVVNGSGGLDDPELEAAVQMVWLAENFGPAAGFGAGILHAFADPGTRWAYLCEDDIGLFGLPAPRVADLVRRLESDPAVSDTGAVVAYGRRFVGRGHSENVVPQGDDDTLVPVDVAAWGATLLSREVIERGVLPDTEWYFGYEDFDFFCRVRASGLQVLVDATTARVAAQVQTTEGRDGAMAGARPNDSDEPWRAYYVARNFLHLARAHGSPSWTAWHFAYSVRRMQMASSMEERLATLSGLVDGLRGRLGRHPRFQRQVGEFDETE
jgi:sulfur carrier protein ThiS